MTEHRTALVTAGPVPTRSVIALRKRRADNLCAGQDVVFREIGITVDP